jgi:23S rRNA (cytosine1962-C5)-methyltransferase
MSDRAVILKKGRDKAIRNRHHWIFSGAVGRLPELEPGEILPVRSDEGELLGHAYFNPRSTIIGRMLSFGETPPLEAVESSLDGALALRAGLLLTGETNACRLVHGEGDGLPGLVVDRYADILVVQLATLGMERLKPRIVGWLTEKVSPRGIYEQSRLPTRREEGLGDVEGWLSGEPVEEVEIRENGLRFLVEIAGSQKTGFFLDLRAMRGLVASLAKGRRVLNCFSYTGAFSVAALAGGAVSADSVDSSRPAMELARRNFALNGLPVAGHSFTVEDVFEYLRRADATYDLVILDPPAFAKRRVDVVRACRGYKDINRLALRLLAPGGLLLTFSCSHFVEAGLFQQVVWQAAVEADRRVRILQRHRLAYDHPVNIFNPESEYLKSLLLYVE